MSQINAVTEQTPNTTAGWEKQFHQVMAELGLIKNSFEAMMFVISTVFPMVQGYNSWCMGNEAKGMKSVAEILNQLNEIKAMFNNCNSPDYWKENENNTKLAGMINTLIDKVNGLKASNGFAASIMTQLKVITQASQIVSAGNQSIWENGKLRTGSYTWWDGTTRHVGTVSSYLMWMWSREWQGLNPVIPLDPKFNQDMYYYTGPTTVNAKHDTWRVSYYSQQDGGIVYVSYSQYLTILQNLVKNGQPPSQVPGTINSPIYQGGQVKFWDGEQWQTESKSDYYNWLVARLKTVQDSHPKGWNDWFTLMPQPYDTGGDADPKFTTGPTTQAFAAISTSLNSQSSEQQSEFKFLQSNMQEYLGIDKTTMTQFVKQEENILGFLKQQSA